MNFFGLARRSVFRKPVKSILLGKCVVVVTHSKHLAEEADEILEIKNGAISFLSE